MSKRKMFYTVDSNSITHQGTVTMTATRSTSQAAIEGATATWVRHNDARYSEGDQVTVTESPATAR